MSQEVEMGQPVPRHRLNYLDHQHAVADSLQQTADAAEVKRKKDANPGIPSKREKGLFVFVLVGIAGVLIWSMVQQVSLYIDSQNHPASSVSYEAIEDYPNVGLLVCPHFSLNLVKPGSFYVKPHLDIFAERLLDSNPTMHFQSSNGDVLEGEIFSEFEKKRVKSQTVTPDPLPTNMYEETSAGCIVMVPSGLDMTIGNSKLAPALAKLYIGEDQNLVGLMTVGVWCEYCEEGKECVRLPNSKLAPALNTLCSKQNVLVSGFSLESGDYDTSKDIVENLKYPCKSFIFVVVCLLANLPFCLMLFQFVFAIRSWEFKVLWFRWD